MPLIWWYQLSLSFSDQSLARCILSSSLFNAEAIFFGCRLSGFRNSSKLEHLVVTATSDWFLSTSFSLDVSFSIFIGFKASGLVEWNWNGISALGSVSAYCHEKYQLRQPPSPQWNNLHFLCCSSLHSDAVASRIVFCVVAASTAMLQPHGSFFCRSSLHSNAAASRIGGLKLTPPGRLNIIGSNPESK